MRVEVNRDADLIDLLIPGERHRTQSLRDERGDLELAARAEHANAIAVLDALLVRELLRQFDERLRLQAHEQRHVLSHVVLVLGQAVARRDVRIVVHLSEAVWSTGRLVVQEGDGIL